MATLCIIVDDKLKEKANKVFDNLGTNMSTAVNMYLNYCVREEEIPYEVCSLKKPTKKLQRALQEADDIISGKVKRKTYDTVEEMAKDILGDDWNA